MNRSFRRAGLLAVISLLLPILAFAQDDPPDILILHSYHMGQVWTEGVMAGMQEVLGPYGEDLRLYVEYMDTKRHHDPTYLIEVLDLLLTYKLQRLHFDLLILSDNDALNFALRHRDKLFAGTPIVFCGINNFQPEMIAGVTEITGVAEYPNFRETLRLALKFHPQAREMVVIGNTRNETDRQNYRLFLKIVPEFDDRLTFEHWDDLPMQELATRLAALPPATLVFINGLSTDEAGRTLPFAESNLRIREATDAPLYSGWDFFLGDGIVGGRLVSSRRHGKLAAQLALRVLDGEEADDIPVITEGTNEYMFDDRQLRRLGIAHRALPPDSIIINRPVPYLLLSRREVQWGLALLAGLCGLLLILLVTMAQRRRAEGALRVSEERSRAMAEELRGANEELDAFVRTVSHDLRAPLTPIIGYAEVLQRLEPEEKAELRLNAAAIEQSGRQMLALLEDLLTLSRAGCLEMPAEPVSIAEVLDSIRANLANAIGETGAVIVAAPLPTVRLPRSTLAVALENLLGNAIRYAGGGGPIEVGGSCQGERVRLYVRDHGPGIPEKERERIFEPFYRGPGAGDLPGTGIGLATVRRIARRCGGHVWVEETPGGGSTFWLELQAASCRMSAEVPGGALKG